MSEHLSSKEFDKRPAMRAAANHLLEHFRPLSCDSVGSVDCVRCSAVATARWLLQLTEQPSHEPCALRDSQPQIIRGVVEQFGQYIVHGTPGHYGWLPEDHELQHNCDAMACGQDHALARFQIERATPPPSASRMAALERALRYWLPDETLIPAGHEAAWNEHVQLIPEHRTVVTKKEIHTVNTGDGRGWDREGAPEQIVAGETRPSELCGKCGQARPCDCQLTGSSFREPVETSAVRGCIHGSDPVTECEVCYPKPHECRDWSLTGEGSCSYCGEAL
jgi:hypothetical protein